MTKTNNKKTQKQNPKPQSTYDALTAMAKQMFVNAESKEKEKKKTLWQQ